MDELGDVLPAHGGDHRVRLEASRDVSDDGLLLDLLDLGGVLGVLAEQWDVNRVEPEFGSAGNLGDGA